MGNRTSVPGGAVTASFEPARGGGIPASSRTLTGTPPMRPVTSTPPGIATARSTTIVKVAVPAGYQKGGCRTGGASRPVRFCRASLCLAALRSLNRSGTATLGAHGTLDSGPRR